MINNENNLNMITNPGWFGDSLKFLPWSWLKGSQFDMYGFGRLSAGVWEYGALDFHRIDGHCL